jgi:hypothetical protein
MKNLYKALAAFQQEVPVILKDTSGYGYTYADLPAIFAVINPLMAKHGMGFYQAVDFLDSQACIKTVVFHVESGEVVESVTLIPQGVSLKGMNDFQVLGSAITYIKRYALSSLLGLVTDKDTDASGEQVKKPKEEKPVNVVDSAKAFELAKKDIEKSTMTEELTQVAAKIAKSQSLTADQKEELDFMYSEKMDELKKVDVVSLD